MQWFEWDLARTFAKTNHCQKTVLSTFFSSESAHNSVISAIVYVQCCKISIIPAGTQRWHNVDSTLIHCQVVELKLLQPCVPAGVTYTSRSSPCDITSVMYRFTAYVWEECVSCILVCKSGTLLRLTLICLRSRNWNQSFVSHDVTDEYS